MRKFFDKFAKVFSKRKKIIIPAVFVLVIVGAMGAVLLSQGLVEKPMLTPKDSEIVKIPETLVSLQANVSLERDGEITKLAESTPVEVRMGDKITTDLNGIAELVYQSGTKVRIGQESSIVFENSNSIFENAGKVYVRFKKLLGIQEEFEVSGDRIIAAVRGTAFSVFIKPGTNPKILVNESNVDVTPKDADGNELTNQKKVVSTGEQAVISLLNNLLTVAPQVPTPEEKDWMDFNSALDSDPGNLGLLGDYASLRTRTPTPVPTATPAASTTPTSAPLPALSSMPGAGYTKSSVVTSVGTFPLACYGASRQSARMLTDSASDSDCTDNCPVLPLHEYAVRNGGVAAINGMYFCPADYPSCAGKVNTFDTLFFNSRTKQYMNSANNIYSNIPFVGMNADRSMSFVGSSSSWGRDTSIIGGTAGNPRLMAGGNYAVNLDALDDKQRNVKSNRGAIVQEGDMIYLCITQNATVPDSGRVFETLGADNAINIDGGGSSALWVGGSYKYGPGRNIPTAIILAP